jgi:hypothetical protein
MYELVLRLENGETHVIAKAESVNEIVKIQRQIDCAVTRWSGGEDAVKPDGVNIDWPLLETCQPYIFFNGKAIGFIEPNGMMWQKEVSQ